MWISAIRSAPATSSASSARSSARRISNGRRSAACSFARCRARRRSGRGKASQRVAKRVGRLHRVAMANSMHDVSDPRNASILINVNGELKPRAEAVVSVFDSGFMLGDGVWEGLRVHKGKLSFLDRHLDRLFEGAKAIAMDVGLSRDELAKIGRAHV